MIGRSALGPVLAAFALMFAVPTASAQEGEAPPLPSSFSEPMPLYTSALGSFTRPISSSNAEAQAYFDQGFQLKYAFAKIDAVRSFREAWKRDPNCAICYWGEAWAWGPFLNGGMPPNQAHHAYTAIQKALALAEDHASPLEKAFIEAMAVRYVENYDPDKRKEQDIAYVEAMRLVAERYPDDLEAATFYADALFLLEPRRGTRDLNDPNVQRLHRVLEGVLERDIRHFGACHLYIHATESTIRPDKAEPCAEYLSDAFPGASHINHMPSHTWNEVGRWGDSVRANLEAWHTDQKAATGGEAFAIYAQHNLHMLLFAASMDGQGAIAIQAGKDHAKLTGNTHYHALTLLRFGRFDEILAIEDRPENEVYGGMWDFAQGYAHLRNDELDFARLYLDRVLAAAESTEAMYRFHSGKDLLGVLGRLLEGAIYRADGQLDAALRSFERAVSLEDDLMYDEPEPFPFAARHWLGAALLEAERYQDAERVYREEVADHPHNGWSLFGLKTALEEQGKSSPEVDADLEASWARSDTWITASRF